MHDTKYSLVVYFNTTKVYTATIQFFSLFILFSRTKVFAQNLSRSLDITFKSEKDQKMFARVKSHDCSSIVENEFVEY